MYLNRNYFHDLRGVSDRVGDVTVLGGSSLAKLCQLLYL